MKKDMKSYEQLTFTDDFMFCKIMTKHQDLCKRLIEIILNVKVKKIKMSLTQSPIELTYDGRGIRLDVYVEDNEGTVYDIEMQTTNKRDLPQRMRYYQGMIDLNLIERGAKFSDLKKSYIIFICTERPFESDLPIYTFRNVCLEDKSFLLEDDAAKVVVNAKGDTTNADPEVKALLEYINNQKIESDFTKDISDAVNNAIDHKEWRDEYMTFAMRLNEERASGRAEGRLEGRAEEHKDILERMIVNIMKRENISKEEAEEKATCSENCAENAALSEGM